MTRINTNVASMIAQHNLQQSNNEMATRLERLSTGLRINSGKDDPAGLIVSERLRSETNSISQAIDNIERASNVIATTEGGLREISNMLNEIKSLAVEAANTGAFSEEEIEANQLQIDSAVESISRIANTTSFAGLNLLNGSLDYVTSGADASKITDIKINGADLGDNGQMPVTVEVLNSAQRGGLWFDGGGTGSDRGTLNSGLSFEIQGTKGVQSFDFASGTPLSAVQNAINKVSDATGVQAAEATTGSMASGLKLQSTGFGEDAFVSVRELSDSDFFQTKVYDEDTDSTGANANRDTGADVEALVNGSLAMGNGRRLSHSGNALDLELTLTSGAAQSSGTEHEFDITGGGSTYQIGPEINALQQIGFGVQSVTATNLGNSEVGFLNSITAGGDNSLVAGNAQQASKIIDTAIEQVASLRGRLGAFERNTLQTTMRSQQVALENLTSAESEIRDADFAKETAKLSRAQVLQQAGTSTLGMANNQSQNVLSLLQQ
jgi:flagellin